mmetsp:Transcript_62409/g.141119  ORF Transcript_62409/g.141119 Transcript_62409/m.141119 type:complete len:317 (+) Transcript_62409:516-1466(+)
MEYASTRLHCQQRFTEGDSGSSAAGRPHGLPGSRPYRVPSQRSSSLTRARRKSRESSEALRSATGGSSHASLIETPPSDLAPPSSCFTSSLGRSPSLALSSLRLDRCAEESLPFRFISLSTRNSSWSSCLLASSRGASCRLPPPKSPPIHPLSPVSACPEETSEETSGRGGSRDSGAPKGGGAALLCPPKSPKSPSSLPPRAAASVASSPVTASMYLQLQQMGIHPAGTESGRRTAGAPHGAPGSSENSVHLQPCAALIMASDAADWSADSETREGDTPSAPAPPLIGLMGWGGAGGGSSGLREEKPPPRLTPAKA